MNTKVTIFSALICGITTSGLAMQSLNNVEIPDTPPRTARVITWMEQNDRCFSQGRDCARRLISSNVVLPSSIDDRTFLLTDDINLSSKDIAARLFGINFNINYEESDSKK